MSGCPDGCPDGCPGGCLGGWSDRRTERAIDGSRGGRGGRFSTCSSGGPSVPGQPPAGAPAEMAGDGSGAGSAPARNVSDMRKTELMEYAKGLGVETRRRGPDGKNNLYRSVEDVRRHCAERAQSLAGPPQSAEGAAGGGAASGQEISAAAEMLSGDVQSAPDAAPPAECYLPWISAARKINQPAQQQLAAFGASMFDAGALAAARRLVQAADDATLAAPGFASASASASGLQSASGAQLQ